MQTALHTTTEAAPQRGRRDLMFEILLAVVALATMLDIPRP